MALQNLIHAFGKGFWHLAEQTAAAAHQIKQGLGGVEKFGNLPPRAEGRRISLKDVEDEFLRIFWLSPEEHTHRHCVVSVQQRMDIIFMEGNRIEHPHAE